MQGLTLPSDLPIITPFTSQLRPINADDTFTFLGNHIIINGNSHTLHGNGTSQGFFVGGAESSSKGSVTINDLTFSQTKGTGRHGNVPISLGNGGGLYVARCQSHLK